MRSLLTRLHFSLKYFSNPPWDTRIPAPELVAWASAHAPGRGLDIGCGTGTNMLYLAGQGWKVVGIDYAPLAILKARGNFKRAGLQATFVTGDITRLCPSEIMGPFDLILDIGCLHAFSADEKAVRGYVDAVRQRLEEKGTLLLYAHMPEENDLSRPWHGFTPEWAQRVFLDSFSLQSIAFGEDKGRQSAWYTFIRT